MDRTEKQSSNQESKEQVDADADAATTTTAPATNKVTKSNYHLKILHHQNIHPNVQNNNSMLYNHSNSKLSHVSSNGSNLGTYEPTQQQQHQQQYMTAADGSKSPASASSITSNRRQSSGHNVKDYPIYSYPQRSASYLKNMYELEKPYKSTNNLYNTEREKQRKSLSPITINNPSSSLSSTHSSRHDLYSPGVAIDMNRNRSSHGSGSNTYTSASGSKKNSPYDTQHPLYSDAISRSISDASSQHGSNRMISFPSDSTSLLRRIQSEGVVGHEYAETERKHRHRLKIKLLAQSVRDMRDEIKSLNSRIQQYEENLHAVEPNLMRYIRRALMTSNVLLGIWSGMLRAIEVFTHRELINGLFSHTVVPTKMDVANPPLIPVLVTGTMNGLQAITPFLLSAHLLANEQATSIRRNISFVMSVLYSINMAITNRRTVTLSTINIILNVAFLVARYYQSYVSSLEMARQRKDSIEVELTDTDVTDVENDTQHEDQQSQQQQETQSGGR